jgi:hypothetical protein
VQIIKKYPHTSPLPEKEREFFYLIFEVLPSPLKGEGAK